MGTTSQDVAYNRLVTLLPVLLPATKSPVTTEKRLETLHEFLKEGLRYFLSGQASQETCWWCNPKLYPLVTQLLHLFSLPGDSLPSITLFTRRLSAQLQKCTSCIDAYTRGKLEYRQQCLHFYDPIAVDLFFKTMLHWDLSRLWRTGLDQCLRMELFTKEDMVSALQFPIEQAIKEGVPFKDVATDVITFPMPLCMKEADVKNTLSPMVAVCSNEVLIFIYEVLQNPLYLNHSVVATLFSLLFSTILTHHTVEAGDQLKPTLFILLDHPWDGIRSWAHRAIERVPATVDTKAWSIYSTAIMSLIHHAVESYEKETSTEIVENADRPVNSRLSLKGSHQLRLVTAVLQRLSPVIISEHVMPAVPRMYPVILSALASDSAFVFVEGLELFATLLEARGAQFWESLPQTLPEDLATYARLSKRLRRPNQPHQVVQLITHQLVTMTLLKKPSLVDQPPVGGLDKPQAKSKRLLQWVYPFIKSISAPSQGNTQTLDLLTGRLNDWCQPTSRYSEEIRTFCAQVLINTMVQYYLQYSNLPSGPEAAVGKDGSKSTEKPLEPVHLSWVLAQGSQLVDTAERLSQEPTTLALALQMLEVVLQHDRTMVHGFTNAALQALVKAGIPMDGRAPDSNASTSLTQELAQNYYLFFNPQHCMAGDVWMASLNQPLPHPLLLRVFYAVADVVWRDYPALLDTLQSALTIAKTSDPNWEQALDHCLRLQSILVNLPHTAAEFLKRMAEPLPKVKQENGDESSISYSEETKEEALFTDLFSVPGILALLRLFLSASTPLRLSLLEWLPAFLPKRPHPLPEEISRLPLFNEEMSPLSLLVAHSPEDSLYCLGVLMSDYELDASKGWYQVVLAPRLLRVVTMGTLVIASVVKQRIQLGSEADSIPWNLTTVIEGLPQTWLRVLHLANFMINQGFAWAEGRDLDRVVRTMTTVFDLTQGFLGPFLEFLSTQSSHFRQLDFHRQLSSLLERCLQSSITWIFVTDEKLRQAVFATLGEILLFPVGLVHKGQSLQSYSPTTELDEGTMSYTTVGVATVYQWNHDLLGTLIKIAKSDPDHQNYLTPNQRQTMQQWLAQLLDTLQYPVTEGLQLPMRGKLSTTATENIPTRIDLADDGDESPEVIILSSSPSEPSLDTPEVGVGEALADPVQIEIDQDGPITTDASTFLKAFDSITFDDGGIEDHLLASMWDTLDPTTSQPIPQPAITADKTAALPVTTPPTTEQAQSGTTVIAKVEGPEARASSTDRPSPKELPLPQTNVDVSAERRASGGSSAQPARVQPPQPSSFVPNTLVQDKPSTGKPPSPVKLPFQKRTISLSTPLVSSTSTSSYPYSRAVHRTSTTRGQTTIGTPRSTRRTFTTTFFGQALQKRDRSWKYIPPKPTVAFKTQKAPPPSATFSPPSFPNAVHVTMSTTTFKPRTLGGIGRSDVNKVNKRPQSLLDKLRRDFVTEKKLMSIKWKPSPMQKLTRPPTSAKPMTVPPRVSSTKRVVTIINEPSSESDYDTSASEKESHGFFELAQGVSKEKTNDQLDRSKQSGPQTMAKRPIKKEPEVRRRIKLIDLPLTNQVKPESSKTAPTKDLDQKKRAVDKHVFKLDVTRLHRVILNWSYNDTEPFPKFPPDMGIPTSCQTVQDSFSSPAEYARVFEPLLLMECWQGLQRAKEEVADAIGAVGKLRRVEHNGGQRRITLETKHADSKDWMELDLLVMSNCRGPEDPVSRKSTVNTIRLAQIRPEYDTMFVKVHSVVHQKDSAEVTVAAWSNDHTGPIFNRIFLGSQWCLWRLTSLTTVQREYLGLYNIGNYHLTEDILKAQVAPLPKISSGQIKSYIKTYGVNPPQAEAILAATRRTRGFSLIQGPPGTGKTRTILGLVGAFLSSQDEFQPFANAHTGTSGQVLDHKIKKSGGSGDGSKKLMLCGPSNAAVDELVHRLMEGVMNAQGALIYPRVVRVGVSDSISAATKRVSLDYLVDSEVDRLGNSAIMDAEDFYRSKGPASTNTLLEHSMKQLKGNQAKLRKLAEERESLQRALREIHQQDQVDISQLDRLEVELGTVKKRQWTVTQECEKEQERQGLLKRGIESDRRRIRDNILKRADILCCTLSGSGHELLNGIGCQFDTVVIDEAAQAVELSCLIPLRYQCRRCILVGDPNQLPPTVLSVEAAKYGYDQSLFVRLQKANPEAVNLLSIQYRMHPEISVFPSRLFYDGQLQDGPNMAEKQRAPWHDISDSFPPFLFLDVYQGRERLGRSKSVYNMVEVDLIIQFVQKLCNSCEDINFYQRIGIITPYRQQLFVLKQEFRKAFGPTIRETIQFNTVDGFQGQEKDIIIFSCVRASDRGSNIGFLSDMRRMNVALTRARKSLFVFGNANFLERHPMWRLLIRDSKRRKTLIRCKTPFWDTPGRRNVEPPDNLLTKETGEQLSALTQYRASLSTKPNNPPKDQKSVESKTLAEETCPQLNYPSIDIVTEKLHGVKIDQMMQGLKDNISTYVGNLKKEAKPVEVVHSPPTPVSPNDRGKANTNGLGTSRPRAQSQGSSNTSLTSKSSKRPADALQKMEGEPAKKQSRVSTSNTNGNGQRRPSVSRNTIDPGRNKPRQPSVPTRSVSADRCPTVSSAKSSGGPPPQRTHRHSASSSTHSTGQSVTRTDLPADPRLTPIPVRRGPSLPPSGSGGINNPLNKVPATEQVRKRPNLFIPSRRPQLNSFNKPNQAPGHPR
ncbi:DEAD-box type RNA helicase [Dispira parvispora]|uniref:DEAD-box type RNA helicase n=1 Tax=Dispira parvispora TaxID=1520584 RepID=A0A9W8AWZ9_9FUNG|nr:DEAD-box type RNA helicase [Dispira parvispora]